MKKINRLDPEKSTKTTLDLLKENLEKEKSNNCSDGEEEEIEIPDERIKGKNIPVQAAIAAKAIDAPNIASSIWD
ncbi:hypothetical protein V6N13_075966 [Hibiscus sabdariffa]